MPSVATAPESVHIETSGWPSAARTSASSIMKMMFEVWPRSAATMSMTTSASSLPSARAISSTLRPSYFLSSGFTTLAIRIPRPPPQQRNWFSQPGSSRARSAFTRARTAGSASRASIFSVPPSRTHTGRLASSPFWPAV